jgi:hypothetical protein
MKLEEIENNIIVEYRVGRAGPNSVIWEPWTKGPLYVNKRTVDLPIKKRYQGSSDWWKAGSIVTLTPNNSSTADFDQDDYCGDGVFCNEDYYLEIKELQKEKTIEENPLEM